MGSFIVHRAVPARKLARFVMIIALGLMALNSTAFAAGDAGLGEKLYTKCAICHSNKAEVNKIGPSLFGIVGRAAATVPNYTYSQAMKDWSKGKKWDVKQMDAWIANPRKLVAATKMSYVGMNDATDRANLIAYLQTLK
ncbi:MAG: cytochrome c family protein [Alphaproteobacteria bacterium]|nr:cytochrome c family protein [Alphaproteobacteria bacterium]